MKKLVLILFLLIIYCTKDSNVSGVVNDTDTGIVIYMKDGKTIGAPVSRYERSLTRKGTIRKKHSMTRVTKG